MGFAPTSGLSVCQTCTQCPSDLNKKILHACNSTHDAVCKCQDNFRHNVTADLCIPLSCTNGLVSSSSDKCTCNAGYTGGGFYDAQTKTYPSCNICSTGTFKIASGSGACSNCATCGPDEMESQQCTHLQNRICQCIGNYSRSSTHNNRCIPNSCENGEIISGKCECNAGYIGDKVLVVNENHAFYSPCDLCTSGYASESGQTTCQDCSECPESLNMVVQTSCTSTTDTFCGCKENHRHNTTADICVPSSCSNGVVSTTLDKCSCNAGFIGGGEFDQTSMTYPDCVECTNGLFQLNPTDTICTVCTQCGINEVENSPCTSTSNRVCGCAANHTKSSSHGNVCVPTTCENGMVTQMKCSCLGGFYGGGELNMDSVTLEWNYGECLPCQDGFYSHLGAESCTGCKTCLLENNLVVQDACTPTSDAVCQCSGSHRRSVNGSYCYPVSCPNGHVDFNSEVCICNRGYLGGGIYSLETGYESCEPCDDGKFMSQITDRVCQDCRAPCLVNEVESQNCTITQDRYCVCETNHTRLLNFNNLCVPNFCPSGTVNQTNHCLCNIGYAGGGIAVASDTEVSYPTCYRCFAGLYADTAGLDNCKTCTECSSELNMQVNVSCTPDSDTECGCIDNHHLNLTLNFCVPKFCTYGTVAEDQDICLCNAGYSGGGYFDMDTKEFPSCVECGDNTYKLQSGAEGCMTCDSCNENQEEDLSCLPTRNRVCRCKTNFKQNDQYGSVCIPETCENGQVTSDNCECSPGYTGGGSRLGDGSFPICSACSENSYKTEQGNGTCVPCTDCSKNGNIQNKVTTNCTPTSDTVCECEDRYIKGSDGMCEAIGCPNGDLNHETAQCECKKGYTGGGSFDSALNSYPACLSCGSGMYKDFTGSGSCLTCSSCTDTQVIINECSAVKNTECGVVCLSSDIFDFNGQVKESEKKAFYAIGESHIVNCNNGFVVDGVLGSTSYTVVCQEGVWKKNTAKFGCVETSCQTFGLRKNGTSDECVCQTGFTNNGDGLCSLETESTRCDRLRNSCSDNSVIPEGSCSSTLWPSCVECPSGSSPSIKKDECLCLDQTPLEWSIDGFNQCPKSNHASIAFITLAALSIGLLTYLFLANFKINRMLILLMVVFMVISLPFFISVIYFIDSERGLYLSVLALASTYIGFLVFNSMKVGSRKDTSKNIDKDQEVKTEEIIEKNPEITGDTVSPTEENHDGDVGPPNEENRDGDVGPPTEENRDSVE